MSYRHSFLKTSIRFPDINKIVPRAWDAALFPVRERPCRRILLVVSRPGFGDGCVQCAGVCGCETWYVTSVDGVAGGWRDAKIVATSFVDDMDSIGVVMQRKLCPYPKVAV